MQFIKDRQTLDQESANYGPNAESGPRPVSLNKGLLEDIQGHSFA